MVLSVNQRSAVHQGEVVPVTVDETECVVIRKDLFQKIIQRTYDDSEVDVREAYPLMDAVAKQEGWDDPSMEIYDDLVPRKP